MQLKTRDYNILETKVNTTTGSCFFVNWTLYTGSFKEKELEQLKLATTFYYMAW